MPVVVDSTEEVQAANLPKMQKRVLEYAKEKEMKRFAILPVLFCLTFPSLGSLNGTLQSCNSTRKACVNVKSIVNGEDPGTYTLFFTPTYATFNLQDFIDSYAPSAQACPVQ